MPERAVPGRNSSEGLIDVGSWLLRHVRKRCEADIGLAAVVLTTYTGSGPGQKPA
jgi:hypothetical protein